MLNDPFWGKITGKDAGLTGEIWFQFCHQIDHIKIFPCFNLTMYNGINIEVWRMGNSSRAVQNLWTINAAEMQSTFLPLANIKGPPPLSLLVQVICYCLFLLMAFAQKKKNNLVNYPSKSNIFDYCINWCCLHTHAPLLTHEEDPPCCFSPFISG